VGTPTLPVGGGAAAVLTAVLTGVCTAPGCPYPVHDSRLCRSHVDALDLHLSQVPELLAELMVTITRQDAVANPGVGGGGADEPPLLFRPEATAAAGDLHDVLEALTVDCAAAIGYTLAELGLGRPGSRPDIRSLPLPPGVAGPPPPPRPPVPGAFTFAERRPVNARAGRIPADVTADLAAWLRRHPSVIAGLPDAGAWVDAVSDAVDRAWYACDRPASRVYLGRHDCELHPDALPRMQELWASPDAPTVTCRACGARFDVGERRAELLAMSGKLLITAELASRALPGLLDDGTQLNPERIRTWARMHGLRRYPPLRADPHRRYRYRVRDLLEHVRLDRERAAARRRDALPSDDLPPELSALFSAVREQAARRRDAGDR
jgi:hypothetical protein